MARAFHAVMTRVLGYERYAVRGSDFGASVAEALAALYPDAVDQLLTNISVYWFTGTCPPPT
jgi:pimeloyl-ACP methyl ester carboxylesterase